MRRALVTVCVLGACQAVPSPDAPTPQSATSGADAEHQSEKEVVASDPIDPRTSYQLAAAIKDASATAWREQGPALEQVRAAWQGKRYRWQVALNPVLCRRADACVVFPFDHARSDEPIVMGWLPRVQLSDAQHTAALDACGPTLCVLDLEGTLATFTLSPEDPTSLSFADVEVHEVRPPKKNESWVRRAADPALAQLRTRGTKR